VETSILKSTKKNLGITAADTSFDLDIITHINTSFSTLTQLGVGPPTGFMIEDDSSVWEDFVGTDLELNSVKTYIYLKTKSLFDPPQTSYLLGAMKDQIRELEWRLNAHREETQWVDPDPPVVLEDEVLLDGGPV
jgi:hypothetical protein